MTKPGRKPTGLKRPHIVQVALTADENEFVARWCYEHGISAATLGRMKLLRNGWKTDLNRLRLEQNGMPLKELDGRRT